MTSADNSSRLKPHLLEGFVALPQTLPRKASIPVKCIQQGHSVHAISSTKKTEETIITTTVFAIHEVSDYDIWRKGYAETGSFRPAGHVISHGVHRREDELNTLMVVHQFQTSQDGHTFWENPELMAIVKSAGVTSIPRLEYFLDT